MRYFIFYYKTNTRVYGSIAIKVDEFPSLKNIKDEVNKTNIISLDIAITGFNELTEKDYNQWIK